MLEILKVETTLSTLCMTISKKVTKTCSVKRITTTPKLFFARKNKGYCLPLMINCLLCQKCTTRLANVSRQNPFTAQSHFIPSKLLMYLGLPMLTEPLFSM